MSFREEQERFNLWVSLINLEHKYGSRATLKAVSERACQNSNPKKVYLHMAEVIDCAVAAVYRVKKVDTLLQALCCVFVLYREKPIQSEGFKRLMITMQALHPEHASFVGLK